jgi:F-type H+-transporting ATPase subunit gamma
MEMVASARFRKAQAKARQAQRYIGKMGEIVDHLSHASTEFDHPLFAARAVKKIGLVVVSSDRGLCGSYNTTVFSHADQFLKGRDATSVELILVGRKAIQYYHHNQWTISSRFPGWSGKITLAQIKEMSNQFVKRFLSGELDEIYLVYTRFYTLMERKVVLEKFLPLGKPKEEKRGFVLNYLFEPNIEEIYMQLLPRFCMTKIETMLNEAHASELVARIFSMKAAAKNATEMIDHLTLERNKVRQTGITREMLETISSIRE